jgi:hypothetical protein
MFTAAYSTDFYRAVRDALHEEVNGWHSSQASKDAEAKLTAMWEGVEDLEPISRNRDAIDLKTTNDHAGFSSIVPIEQLTHGQAASAVQAESD